MLKITKTWFLQSASLPECKRCTKSMLINKTPLPLLNPSVLGWGRRDTRFSWIYSFIFHLSFTWTRRKPWNYLLVCWLKALCCFKSKKATNLYSWVWGFLHWSHDFNALQFGGQLMTVLQLWVGTNSQPPPNTQLSTQQDNLMLSTKHSKIHLPTTISWVKWQFRERNLCLTSSAHFS